MRLVLMLASLAVSDVAFADPVPADHAIVDIGHQRANPATMSCEDFLAYDDVTKPSFVYWADGYSRAGRPDRGEVDVDRLNHLVPVLIEACGKDRHAPFLEKMKQMRETLERSA